MPVVDDFTILYPTGLVMRVGMGAPVNGTGTFGTTLVAPVQTGGVTVAGTGVTPVDQLSGRQGTIRIVFTVGEPVDGPQALVFVGASPGAVIGLTLTRDNQPVALLVGADEFTVAGGTPMLEGEIPAGTQLDVTLVWNSQERLSNGLYAGVLMGDLVADWAAQPLTSWVPFVPQFLSVGTIAGGLGGTYEDFTGTVQLVQVSDTALFDPPPGAVPGLAYPGIEGGGGGGGLGGGGP